MSLAKSTNKEEGKMVNQVVSAQVPMLLDHQHNHQTTVYQSPEYSKK